MNSLAGGLWTRLTAPSPTYTSPFLAVGFGGDIPVFPPFVAVGTVMAGNLLGRALGGKAWVPARLAQLPTRAAIFLAVLAANIKLKALCDEHLAKVGAEFNFTPVGGVATTGPYAFSRNAMYMALCCMPLAMAVLLNNRYIFVTWMLLPLYLHLVVVPAEERFLAAQFPAAYAAYAERVPRWLPYVPL